MLKLFIFTLSVLVTTQAQTTPKTQTPPPPLPTPAEINTAVGILQSQVAQSKIQPTPPLEPIQLKREPATTRNTDQNVPQDFQEHTPVALPATAQQAIITGFRWNNDVNLPTQGRDGRVTYNFGEGLPILVCSPLRVCIIELQSGEQFTGVPHIGDAVRWDISIESSGAGETARPIVVLKPRDRDLDTTLFVTTNRRSYYIRLISSAETYTPLIAFTYPEEQRAELARQIEEQKQHKNFIAQTQVSAVSTPPENLFFNYVVKGGNAYTRPVRIMDDGAKTYIQMSPAAIHRELPSLAIEGPAGRELVNFRVKDNTYIVDRLFDHAVLLLGSGKHTQKVEIIRDTKQNSHAAAEGN
jgi:P-type conjugative transfer protein TrbG